MTFEFKLPDLGEGIHEAEVLKVKVKEGQIIKEDDPLFEVETDKAVVEIPSPVAGKVLKLYVKDGGIATVGSTMISIETKDGTVKQQEKQETKIEQKPRTQSASNISTSTFANQKSINAVIATPSTRRLARELKIDLNSIKGSGPGGRILKEDIQALANKSGEKKVVAVTQPINLPDFKQFGEIERIPVKSLRKKTAQQMALSWSKIPHVTHCDEVDIQQLENLRRKYEEQVKNKGGKLTITAFIVKAVTIALQDFPQFNSSFDEQSEEIILKRYHNIGLAVATERGLIVPIIKSTDKKNILELAIEISKIVDKTRAGKVELSDLQGGTFTVTNIGTVGGTMATPIINYLEAAILAVLQAKEKAIVKNNKIEVSLIMPLALAFDHRITDGAEAARFMRKIVELLEKPSTLESQIGI